MSVVISQALALALIGDDNADLPILLWDSVVTVANVSSGDEDPDYPATNLANTATHLLWKQGSTADNYLTVDFAGEVDSVGVARHNFGSGQVTVSIEAEIDAVWTEVVDEFIPADDTPLFMVFTAETVTGVRVKLQPGSVAPQAAVLYVGEMLRFERGVQVHTPLKYGRKRDVYAARSVSGEYLGQIVTGASVGSDAQFNYLTPAWYRQYLDPFIAVAAEVPFFFAWKPETYPGEAGFAWLRSDVQPQMSHLAGYFNVTLPMDGLGV